MKNLLFLASILSASLASAETASNTNKNTQLYALGGIRRASIKHNSETVDATATSYHSTFGIFIEKTRENGKFVNGLVLGVMTGYSAKVPHEGEHDQKHNEHITETLHKKNKAEISEKKRKLPGLYDKERKEQELTINVQEEHLNARQAFSDIEEKNVLQKGIQYFGGVSFGCKVSPAITLSFTPGILAGKTNNGSTQATFASIAKAELKVTENLNAFVAYQFETPRKHIDKGQRTFTTEHCTHSFLIGFGSKF